MTDGFEYDEVDRSDPAREEIDEACSALAESEDTKSKFWTARDSMAKVPVFTAQWAHGLFKDHAAVILDDGRQVDVAVSLDEENIFVYTEDDEKNGQSGRNYTFIRMLDNEIAEAFSQACGADGSALDDMHIYGQEMLQHASSLAAKLAEPVKKYRSIHLASTVGNLKNVPAISAI